MSKKLTIEKSLWLNLPPSAVWDALTKPEFTKKIFFGCEPISDWKVGSPLNYKTTVNGREMVVVKGVIAAIEPRSLLKTSCFTPEFENVPSEHTMVTWTLSAENGGTRLGFSQGPFAAEETYRRHEDACDKVLGSMTTVLEERLQRSGP